MAVLGTVLLDMLAFNAGAKAHTVFQLVGIVIGGLLVGVAFLILLAGVAVGASGQSAGYIAGGVGAGILIICCAIVYKVLIHALCVNRQHSVMALRDRGCNCGGNCVHVLTIPAGVH